MRLKTINIINFRAINGDNNQIEFGNNNIIFIFGKNNIGKSSILYAYKYFTSPNQKALVTDFFESNNNPITIEATYIKEISDETNFSDKGLNKWVSINNEVKFKKTWFRPEEIAKKQTFDPSTNNYVDNGFGGLEPILTSAIPNIIHIEAILSIDALSKWIDEEIKKKLINKVKENHKDEYEEALKSVKILQEKIEGEEYLTKIKQGANKYFSKTFPELELNISANPYKEADLAKSFEKDFNVTIGIKKNENEDTFENIKNYPYESQQIDRPFNLHGHGLIRQAIINILGIFKDSKDQQKHIILFEEPELYLHPSNIRKFRDTLYDIAEQENYQIICVLHNPQLIDLSRPHTSLARFVKFDDKKTAIYQAGDDIFSKNEETKNRIQMLNRFNPHICETFFSDEIILVEGDTEAIVLRFLLDKYYSNKEIFVLNAGSKNNIPFFIQVLSHFKIKQHIIHDSDERYLYKDGTIKKNKNGENTKNSAWVLNQTIWDSILEANENGVLVKRYVSIRNFENSHNYIYDQEKGKPYSAFEFAKSIDFENSNYSIVNFLKIITGESIDIINYSQEYLEKNVPEPY